MKEIWESGLRQCTYYLKPDEEDFLTPEFGCLDTGTSFELGAIKLV